MLAWAENGARMVDVDAAFAELEDLHRRFPDNPVIAFDRATALTRHGSWNQAEAAWRTFLDLEPDECWARIAREQLNLQASGRP
jgi:predicted Zn-dependent protease